MLSPNFRTGFVALFGRPNVGKSTLLNHLIGEKLAAVSPKAQTTRRRFRGIRSDDDSQMIFVDTPGIHRAPQGEKLNEFCVAEAFSAMEDADVYLYLIDGTRPFQPTKENSDEFYLLQRLKKLMDKNEKPLYVLVTKSDAWAGAKFATQADLADALQGLPVKGIFPVSAKSGAGVKELITTIKEHLPLGEPLYPTDELTDQNLRQIAAELIQEKLFYLLGQELPYSCAVEVEKFLEVPGKAPEVHASIHVERESQKPMVIGKGGAKIKEIGISARESLETLMGGKVVLKLFVKVTPKWTQNAEQLKQLGYALPEARKQ